MQPLRSLGGRPSPQSLPARLDITTAAQLRRPAPRSTLSFKERSETGTMSRNILPFVRKSFTRKDPQLLPLVALVGGGLSVGAYYFVRHAFNSPELVVSKANRSDYAAGHILEHVPENDPTFSALRRLKNKPIAAFDKDDRYSMEGLHHNKPDQAAE